MITYVTEREIIDTCSWPRILYTHMQETYQRIRKYQVVFNIFLISYGHKHDTLTWYNYMTCQMRKQEASKACTVSIMSTWWLKTLLGNVWKMSPKSGNIELKIMETILGLALHKDLKVYIFTYCVINIRVWWNCFFSIKNFFLFSIRSNTTKHWCRLRSICIVYFIRRHTNPH